MNQCAPKTQNGSTVLLFVLVNSAGEPKKKACVPVFILCGGGFILSQPSARSAPVLSVEIGKEDNVRQKHFTA